MSRIAAIDGLDPTAYSRSPLHMDSRLWPEKNCYVDIWIEVLHALRLEPLAVMPFVLSIDFEGDQWTFFKPPHSDLRSLYGVDVQELTVWRPLLEHAKEHLRARKLISVEADAYWLPDTAGTDYRRQHTKTTIVLNDLDPAAKTLGYFHNSSYHQMQGEDYESLFRIDAPDDPSYMPFFAELIRYDRVARRDLLELARLSKLLLVSHFAWRPAANPISNFSARMEEDLPRISELGLQYYHSWAFATIRQLGAAFELAADYLVWTNALGVIQDTSAEQQFRLIASGCKSLILKGARAVNSRKRFDALSALAPLEAAWSTGMRSLQDTLKS